MFGHRNFAALISIFSIATAVTLYAPIAQSADFSCPEPTKQVTGNIAAATNVKARRLLHLPESKVKNEVQGTVINLWAAYPAADRVAILQNLQSISCNLLKTSSLSDEKKLAEWRNMLKEFSHFFPAANSEVSSGGFALRYLWLDEVTLSLLFAGHTDDTLQKLVGTNPYFVRNNVYSTLETIIRRFSYSVKCTTPVRVFGGGGEVCFPSYGNIMYDNSGNVGSDTIRFEHISEAVSRRLKVYAGSEVVIWPDIDALRTVIKTKYWPENYKMTYTEYGPSYAPEFLLCTVLYRTLSQHEVANYWSQVKRLEQAVMQNELKDHEVYAVVRGSLMKSKLGIPTLGDPTLEALQYFGRNGWPEDFLLAFGNADGRT